MVRRFKPARNYRKYREHSRQHTRCARRPHRIKRMGKKVVVVEKNGGATSGRDTTSDAVLAMAQRLCCCCYCCCAALPAAKAKVGAKGREVGLALHIEQT